MFISLLDPVILCLDANCMSCLRYLQYLESERIGYTISCTFPSKKKPMKVNVSLPKQHIVVMCIYILNHKEN